MGQVVLHGTMTDIQGTMSSKGATGGPWGTYTRLTLDILEMLVNKKKVLGVTNGSFETYTRYSGVVDEEQKKV